MRGVRQSRPMAEYIENQGRLLAYLLDLADEARELPHREVGFLLGRSTITSIVDRLATNDLRLGKLA